MRKSIDPSTKLSELLLKWRWLLMLILAFSIIGIEFYEHQPVAFSDLDIHFWRETPFFGIILPFLGGIVFSLLARTRSERVDAIRSLDRQYLLSKHW